MPLAGGAGHRFSHEGSREPVRVRRRRAGEPRRRHAVPGRRRERQRLLRLAARDPCPGPGRGGGRAARPHRPRVRRPSPRLRLAARPRRAAPRGPAPLAPARRAADARDGPPPAGDVAGRRGRPTAATTCRWRRTCSTGTSSPTGPTRSGWPTSATCRQARAGCTWPRIEDLATREIVGWSMADHLRADLCVDALVMALQRRRPGPGLVHHSDRGVQGGLKRSSQHPSAPTAAPHQGPQLAFASRASCAGGR